MEIWITSLISGFVGAVAGGLLSAWGSVRAVRAEQRDLEADEVRRQRISCLVNLMGLRFTLNGEKSPATQEDRSKAMYELNRAIALWAGNVEVCNLLRDVRSGQTVGNVTRLLRAMSRDTSLQFESLSDSDLDTIFVIDGQRSL